MMRYPILVTAMLLVAAPPVLAQTQPAYETIFAEGLAARRAGDFDRAIERLEQAVALKPESAEALYNLGLVYAFSKRYEEANTRLERARALAPNDIDIQLALARVRAWRNDFSAALAAIDEILVRQPGHLEARAMRGRVLFYQGRLDSAATEFRTVLARDPNQVEALLGLGDVQSAQGDQEAARATWRRAAAADPGSRDAADRLARPMAPEKRWRLDVGGYYSSFERQSREPWREGAVQLSYSYSFATQVHARSEVSQRFGKFDTYFQTGLDHRFNPWLTAYGAVGGTPDADFREKNAVLAGGSVRLRDDREPIGATLALLDAKRAHYSAGTAETVSPGVQQYFLDGQLWLTAKRIFSDSESDKFLKGWSLRGDARPFDRIGVYAGLADAPESSEGRTQPAKSRFGGMSFDLTADLTLRLDYLREDRARSYIREQIGLGLGLRF